MKSILILDLDIVNNGIVVKSSKSSFISVMEGSDLAKQIGELLEPTIKETVRGNRPHNCSVRLEIETNYTKTLPG